MQVRQLGYIRFLAQPRASAHQTFLDFVPASRQLEHFSELQYTRFAAN